MVGSTEYFFCKNFDCLFVLMPRQYCAFCLVVSLWVESNRMYLCRSIFRYSNHSTGTKPQFTKRCFCITFHMEIFTGAGQFELHAAVQPLSSSILPLQEAHCIRRGSTRSSRTGFIVPQSSIEQHFVEDEVKGTVKGIILSRPRMVGESRTVKNLTLPECEFKISGIPNAGNGVHATKDFKKGEIVGEYGDEVITAADAKRRRDKGDDSHIRSVGRVVSNGFALDCCLRGGFTKEYYAQNHLMGSFF